MKINLRPEECYGCGLCAAVCPQHAIAMREDDEGFSYPHIDGALCVKCGVCEKKCPYHSNVRSNLPIESYAAVNRNREVLGKSSSGGVFAAAAHDALKSKGIVYGCVLDEGFRAMHRYAEDLGGIEGMHGSKYIQSSMQSVFDTIKTHLQSSKMVLFVGTPCQTAAIRSFLGESGCEKLLLIDLICHGVSPYKLFRKSLDYLEQKYRGRLISYQFRGKYDGWGKTSRAVVRKGHRTKDILIRAFDSYYMDAYFKRAISRPCCYECKFAAEARVGDITIGDLWGANEILSPEKRGAGVSALIVNTEKGRELVRRMQGDLYLERVAFDRIKKKNGNLQAATPRPANREKTMERMLSQSGSESDAEYRRQNAQFILGMNAKRFMRIILPQFIIDSQH